MKCPCCLNEMISTHSDYYDNILQNGYQCVSAFCVSNQMGAVWIKNDIGCSAYPVAVFPPDGISKSVCLEMISLSQIHKKNKENDEK